MQVCLSLVLLLPYSDSVQPTLCKFSKVTLTSTKLVFNLTSHFQFSASTLLEIADHSFHLETIFSFDFWDLTLSWFLSVPLTPFSVSFIYPFPLPNFPAIVSQDSALLHLFSLILSPHSISNLMALNISHVLLSL